MNNEEIETLNRLNALSKQVIGAAIEVHRELGPGLYESVYELCLLKELELRCIHAVPQVPVPVIYKGIQLDKEFKIDILVEDELVIELKAVDTLKAVHEVQLTTYLKLTGKKIGLLISFNVPVLKDGIKRKVNGFHTDFGLVRE